MKIIQAYKQGDNNWEYRQEKEVLKKPLVLVFGNRLLLEDKNVLEDIRKEFPYEDLVFGSTAGEIICCHVIENSITVIAIEFEKSSFVVERESVFKYEGRTKQLGEELYKRMPKENLKHLFVLSEGSFVNGSSLLSGLESNLALDTFITGGVCGDDDRYEKTLASYKEDPKEGEVVVIGFYGDTLEVSFASYGGWTPFGPERIITKSEANILYEIDGKPALEVYKNYLGDKADQLPKISVFYPLNVTLQDKGKPVVRSIVDVVESDQSIVLAGDVPLNSKVQLMLASVDGIVSGARKAAEFAMQSRKSKPQVAFIISCMTRKVMMGQRVEEEIEQVQEILGKGIATAGFYSYGEIAPFHGETSCDLHNQTMTLTLISE